MRFELGSAAFDGTYAGVFFQKLEISAVNPPVKFYALHFHSVVFVSAVLAVKCVVRRDVQKNR